jgi:hypothetical protein
MSIISDDIYNDLYIKYFNNTDLDKFVSEEEAYKISYDILEGMFPKATVRQISELFKMNYHLYTREELINKAVNCALS